MYIYIHLNIYIFIYVIFFVTSFIFSVPLTRPSPLVTDHRSVLPLAAPNPSVKDPRISPCEALKLCRTRFLQPW